LREFAANSMVNSMQTYSDLKLYSNWVRTHDTLRDSDRQAILDGVRRLRRPPLFSIVMLTESDGSTLVGHESVASVRDQLYPHWELWLPGYVTVAERDTDKRLRIIPGSEVPMADHAALLNSALSAAEGEFVLPLLLDITLPASALYELAAVIADNPNTDLLYTDEDRLTETGVRCMPRFKTGWDPDLALGRDAIGLLVAYRKAALDRHGGMRTSLPSVTVALYEMSLRIAFATPAMHIRHVPAVLCHRRGSSEASLGWDAEGAREVVREYLAEDGVSATVTPAPLAPSWNRIMRHLPDPAPLVSVIVPTRDRSQLLECVVDAVLSRTDYPALELLIVDNDSQEPDALGLLRCLSQNRRVRVLSHPGPFNFAALNNRAAHAARGEVLVLLNNDTDSIQPGWLREMVSHAVRPDIGAVGAKLLYPDGRVQHGGMVLGPTVWPQHQLRFADRLDPGPGGELALTRTVSIVTGACLAVRRSVFFEVGGLNEELRVDFNDIDFCLRIGDHGYRIVWTPFAELFHFEAASRGNDGEPPDKLSRAVREAKYFSHFWNSLLIEDPFHNPNVVYGWDSTVLSEPPRRKRPWLT
jgi:GT2 family glycosyltransferase